MYTQEQSTNPLLLVYNGTVAQEQQVDEHLLHLVAGTLDEGLLPGEKVTHTEPGIVNHHWSHGSKMLLRSTT